MDVQPIRDKGKIKQIKARMISTGAYRDYLIFTLGINSGLRISDILKLKFGDILEANNKIIKVISIREKKTQKRKSFPINNRIKEAINFYLDNLSFKYKLDQLLFCSEYNNKAITRGTAYRIIKKWARGAGIQYTIGTHTLRKTFGYHCYKKGVDLTLIVKLLNHSSESQTLNYIGITKDDMDGVYTNLNL